MVCTVESSGSGNEILNIKNYILEKYVPANVTAPNYSVILDDAETLKQSQENAQLRCSGLIWPFGRSNNLPTEVPIKSAQLLVQADDETNVKSIWELSLEMELASDDYQPGDTIAILPFNDLTDVEKLLRCMELEGKSNINFHLQISPKCTKKIAKVPPYISADCTPYRLLRDCLNIHAIPKKQFLSALANCCTNGDEGAFLNCLSSKEASCHYNKLILEGGLTLLDLLALCPSCKPTMEILIEHLPRLLPRAYSIANSPLDNEIKIIFSLLPQKPGVTTNMLKTLASTICHTLHPVKLPKVIVYGRRINQFRFTAEEASENNHILIGIGTAVSPFLGFLEKKAQLLCEGAYKSLGNTWLIAGAATEQSLPHRNRILAYEQSNVLQRYHDCLSRVPDATYQYVQEQLLAISSEFVEFLMQEKTILYVCADGGTISKAIELTIAECLAQEQQITLNEALRLIKVLRGNGKYREDLWL